MKIIAIISVCLAGVLARRSGPYLPSGWKPDGPAFYLPSEVAKPDDVKEVLQESEASGSDFLREYGPPKTQEVTQELSQQGLPDVDSEKYFVEAVIENNGDKETDVVAVVTEEKAEVNSVVQSVEAVTVTESQIVEEANISVQEEIVSKVEEEATPAYVEITTVANAAEPIVVEEIAYIEPTVAVEAIQETNEARNQLISQAVEESVVDAQQATLKEGSEQTVTEVEELTVTDATQAASDSESTSIVNEKSEVSVEASGTTVSQQTEFSVESSGSTTSEQSEVRKETSGSTASQQTEVKFDVVSAVQESIQTVEEEVKKVEEVVQNIPELIVSLENEIKTQQVETIQEIPVVVQETLGSLEQAPEGFLEYGPPGFREYGPPNEELSNTIEEVQPIENNETRRRRFSPKFRPSKKSH